jgi:hypothetical protein
MMRWNGGRVWESERLIKWKGDAIKRAKMMDSVGIWARG